MAPSTERDTPKWAEPLAGLHARVRYQSYLLLTAFLVIALEAVLLFALATRAAAHVYEIRPDGQAAYIGDRESHLAPRASEARYVAKQFVQLLYGWNSSTVHDDVAAAVNMCAPAMAEQLRSELAASQFIEKLRQRSIRSEVKVERLEVLSQSRASFTVRVEGKAELYPLAQYDNHPSDVRPFAVTVVLAIVPRDTDLRLNGLEVVRIAREEPQRASGEKGRPRP